MQNWRPQLIFRHSLSSSKVWNAETASEGRSGAPLPRNWECFHHQRRCAFRSAWAWKGFGSGCWHAARMGQNWQPPPHPDRSYGGGAPLLENKLRGLGLSQEGRWSSIWFASWLLVQHCNAAALLGTSGSRHAGARNTPREMQALQDFRWGTAISTCTWRDQHAEQTKVLSCCGTCSSPRSTAFVQLIWPWGCSVQLMLCSHLSGAQRSSYCTGCDNSQQIIQSVAAR